MTKRRLLGCTGFIGTALFVGIILALGPQAEANQKSRITSRVSVGIPTQVCGDGILESPEECDDGNTKSGDGCSDGCKTEFCGDGVVNNSTETCDDGNTTSGDGCSADCLTETSEKCGDGVVQPPEECDDGNATSGDGCSDGCKTEFCGDGVVNNNTETCDDGNTTSGDGCSADCLTETEKCGDGVTQPPEECDDGNTDDGDGCSSDCLTEKCGDGVVQPPEECDDGNNVDGDGCSAVCIVEKEGEGCTPGYWKNHTEDWVGYAPTDTVGSVFTVPGSFSVLAGDSLHAALSYPGGPGSLGAARILLRAGVAALLNEAHPNVDYSVSGVIGLVNAALATGDRSTMLALAGLLDSANNDGSCNVNQ
jgi:cysteine-rich repeat protein